MMNLKIKLLLIFVLSVTVSLVSAAEYNAQELGKLFTSPSERQKIDAQRRGEASEQQVTKRVVPSSISVNGLVVRKGGNSSVWINGKKMEKNQTVDGVKAFTLNMSKKKNLKIPILVDGKSVQIQPGQSWSDDTNTVVENY